MALYSAWCDYFATGEGRTIMVMYCIAEDEDDLRKKFSDAFHPYYAPGMQFEDGIKKDDIFAHMVPHTVTSMLEEGGCYFDFYTSFHYNFS